MQALSRSDDGISPVLFAHRYEISVDVSKENRDTSTSFVLITPTERDVSSWCLLQHVCAIVG